MAHCNHIASITAKEPTGKGCEECLKMGAQWMHLRHCLECGHVGCCDNSPNKHATTHFHSTKHPIIKSFEPGEEWGFCYVDNLDFDPEYDEDYAKLVAPIKHTSYLD
ncbi:MAG: UBP-type zinc finger domain-containing protein [Candidatus Kapaibacterium sp.]|jgi:uncharacterized UBP type Zn finger protein